MEILWNLLPSLITLVCALVIVALAYGKLSQKVENVIEDMERSKEYINGEVQRMKESCGLCQSHLCDKIDEVKTATTSTESKLEEFKKDSNKSMLTISGFMGRIDQYIKDFKELYDAQGSKS